MHWHREDRVKVVVIAGWSSTGCHCIFKTFHRCFVNIYRCGFESPARNGELKSMSFVHSVSSILVDNSFFCPSFFCFSNTNTSVRSLIFFPVNENDIYISFFLRKMLGTRYGFVGTRFSLMLGTRIGSLKRLKKPVYIYIYRKAPSLSFSQGPHTTLIRPCPFPVNFFRSPK